MRKLIYILLAASPIVFTGCKLDTYDEPGETLTGRLVDPDGEPFITEQPNGFKIRMLEDGATQYYDFWGMADGTFRNTKIFKANYTIKPFDGAFFPIEPVEKSVSGNVTIDFEVIPYAKITATIVSVGSDVKATFNVVKADGAGKIKDAQLLVTKWNPNVGIHCRDKNASRNYASVPDGDIQAAAQELTIAGYLESGITYYARVAVLCENDLGRYNLSAVTKITVP